MWLYRDDFRFCVPSPRLLRIRTLIVRDREKSQAQLGLLSIFYSERLEVFLLFSPTKNIVSFALYQYWKYCFHFRPCRLPPRHCLYLKVLTRLKMMTDDDLYHCTALT